MTKRNVGKVSIVRAAVPELNVDALYVAAFDEAEAAMKAVSAVAPISWPLSPTDYELSRKTLRRLGLKPGEVRRL